MARTNVVGGNLAVLVCLVLFSAPVWAQSSSGMAGVVRDAAGKPVAGVKVEASSPALIEKIRTAFTDSQGLFKIVDLPTGTYDVTFSAAGFSTVKNAAIELPSAFTATVNASLKAGSPGEVITVTGTTTQVDTQRAASEAVLSNEQLSSLPTGQTTINSSASAVTPGLANAADVGGSSGLFTGQTMNNSKYHGKSGGKTMFDGLRNQNFCTGGSPGYMVNTEVVQDMSVQTGGMTAESNSSGVGLNMIPKSGSNTFKGSATGMYTNERLQSDNINQSLRDRGLTSTGGIANMYDASLSTSGPIRKDKLWYFLNDRAWGSRNYFAGLYLNKTLGAPIFTPDLTQQATRYERNYSPAATRITWQATPRNKYNFFIDMQKDWINAGGTGSSGTAREAQSGWRMWPAGGIFVSWSSPLTSKLLLEAGAAANIFHYPFTLEGGLVRDPSIVTTTNISILELSTNFRYNAPANPWIPSINYTDRYNQRFSISYVTGAHAFKVGFGNEQGVVTAERANLGRPDGVTYIFNKGVPSAVVENAMPYADYFRQRAEIGLYAQDRWTIKRLTLNYGLRFDYVNSYTPKQSFGAGVFTGARSFDEKKCIPCWTDLSPRVGAAYDLFGTGRTAVKGSVARYTAITGSSFISANSPVTTSVNSVQRVWNDLTTFPAGDPRNGNYVPDCDLTNPALNGECGPISDNNFGKGNPKATEYAQNVLNGFGVRGYFWEYGVELQQQVGRRIGIIAGYYHNWSGNFLVTRNTLVTPADYSPYCITAPSDPRLPNGGGYPVCGLYDVAPALQGQNIGLVSDAKNYTSNPSVTCGTQKPGSFDVCGKNDYINLTVNARVGNGIRVGGGMDMGRGVTNNCFVADTPQQLLNCNVVSSWMSNSQFKMNGSVPLPAGFTLAGTFQNVAGPAILADFPVSNAAIFPSLGRNLASCGTKTLATCTATATAPLIVPNTQYEGRRTQVDVRLTKSFKVGGKARLQAKVDVYNAFNDNAVLSSNNTFGDVPGQPRWNQPLTILAPRMVQFSARLDF